MMMMMIRTAAVKTILSFAFGNDPLLSNNLTAFSPPPLASSHSETISPLLLLPSVVLWAGGGEMAGAAKRAAGIARERSLDLEYDVTRLGVSSKAYHEAAEIQMERNRTKIRAAKVENRQVRAALDTLLFAERASFHVSDLQRQVERVKELRRIWDQQKNVVLLKLDELDRHITKAKSAQLDLKGIVEDTSVIHALQAHTCLIHNRIRAAKMLRRSYTATVTPLRRERAAFESMMANYEKVLKTKQGHLKRLIFLYHDAERARTQSKYELNEILLAGRYSDIRYNRDKKTGDSKEEMAEMDTEVAKVRDAFNVPSMKEAFLQLLEQEKRTQYYQQIYRQLMDVECSSGLSATQRAMLRQKIPGIHVMHEVVDIENLKRGPLFVERTKYAVELVDGGGAGHRRASRHSGNLVNMVMGTKRMADRILMDDWRRDASAQVLGRCKKELLKLLKEVREKIRLAKKEKEVRSKVGEEIEDQMYDWIGVVESRHAEREREMDALRASHESKASQAGGERQKSLLEFLMTPVTPTTSSSVQDAQGAIRQEIEQVMERWIQTIQQACESHTAQDPRQEVQQLLESWIQVVEEKHAEQADLERRRREAQDIADVMQSWISSPEHKQRGEAQETLQQNIRQEMDAWLAVVEHRHSQHSEQEQGS